jgi:hypothetical protein
MKSTFVLVFLFVCSAIFAQTYSPIAVTGKRLSIGYHQMGAPYPTQSLYEFIGEDTIISGINYKKLLSSDFNNEFNPEYQLIGFIRETEERQVYLRDTDGVEGLYFDYYVEEDDTIDFYNPFLKYLYDEILPDLGNDTLCIVESVYFETIEDTVRKFYTVRAFGENSLTPETFIEGVGSLSGHQNCGMYKFFALVGSGISLLCADYEETTIYHNELFSDCFITNTKEISNAKATSIYPNPCNTKFSIKNSDSKYHKISIYNILGEILIETDYTNETSFDANKLKAGTYIINIQTEKNIYTEKLLISR